MTRKNLPSRAKLAKTLEVCCGCSLLCDDVAIQIDDKIFSASSNVCSLGLSWLEGVKTNPFAAWMDGVPVELQSAMERSRILLHNAKNPMIVGIDRLSVAAQFAAANLARKLRGSIDLCLHDVGQPARYALQYTGKVTATLGEVARRSDTVVLWYVDPMRSHPRLFERICKSAKRIFFIYDETEPLLPKFPTHDVSKVRLSLKEADALLTFMRCSAIEEAKRSTENTRFRSIKDTIAQSHYVSFFCDSHFGGDDSLPMAIALHELVRRLNDSTRAVLLTLSERGNALGGESVLASMFGFMNAINLNSGFPRSNGSEFSTQSQLAANQCDVVLWICDEPAEKIRSIIQANPLVRWIIWNQNHAAEKCGAEVCVNISAPGLDEPGDIFRMDDVVLPVHGASFRNGASPQQLIQWLTDEHQKLAEKPIRTGSVGTTLK